jgi:Carboxypeptidase regulatory-like domain
LFSFRILISALTGGDMKSILSFFAPLLGLSLMGAVGLWQPDKSSVFFAPVQSQTTEKRAGSITGRIVIGGNPAPGVDVMLLGLDSSSSRRTPVATTKTDEDGHYQFKGVAPGSYDLFPSAPGLVLPKEGRYGQPGKTVAVKVGEAVEEVDFIVVQGGVVTGRVANEDGRPIVGEAVKLDKIGEQGYLHTFYPTNYQGNEMPATDDRGEYRVIGVPPGHYLVSVGVPYGLTRRTYGERGNIYKQTFHPGVTDQSEAISIDVKEGLVSSGVDITVGPALKTYVITGRILDAEDKPLPGIRLNIITESEDKKSRINSSGPVSDSKGEFRVEGALQGHYRIAPQNDTSSNSLGESVAFEVKDENVSGLEIKMSRGSSISGIVVVEGNKDTKFPDKLSDLGIMAHEFPSNRDSDGTSSSKINSDGSFRISGLRPGKARVNLTRFSSSAPREFVIMRIESNGVEQHDGIEVGEREQITGVRVVIGSGTGVIRGEVRIDGGKLEDVRLSVFYQRSGVNSQSYGGIDIDARGRFTIEKLAPGDYELMVGPMTVRATGGPGGKTMSRMPTVKQTVSVRSGAESEVTLVLSLRP